MKKYFIIMLVFLMNFIATEGFAGYGGRSGGFSGSRSYSSPSRSYSSPSKSYTKSYNSPSKSTVASNKTSSTIKSTVPKVNTYKSIAPPSVAGRPMVKTYKVPSNWSPPVRRYTYYSSHSGFTDFMWKILLINALLNNHDRAEAAQVKEEIKTDPSSQIGLLDNIIFLLLNFSYMKTQSSSKTSHVNLHIVYNAYHFAFTTPHSIIFEFSFSSNTFFRDCS